MPHKQGKPHHGSVWYAFASRWRLMQNMERELSIARTQILHRRIELRTPPRSLVAEAIVEPPMSYVEEVILEEGMQDPLEYLLFTVSDSWAPPSDFRVESSMPITKKHQDGENESTQEEFSTYFIEEEILEETTSQAVVPEGGTTLDESERSEGVGREAKGSRPGVAQRGSFKRAHGNALGRHDKGGWHSIHDNSHFFHADSMACPATSPPPRPP